MPPALARACRVHRLPTSHPADVAPLLDRIESGSIPPAGIKAIFGKTEGNGCVNDFTRAYAVQALHAALAGPLGCSPGEVGRRVAIVMSGGTEGGLSPHILVFTEETIQAAPPAAPRLAIGTAATRAFLPEDIGRTAQVDATADAVRAAMRAAAITDPDDVHYVQVKCPLLTGERIAAALTRGQGQRQSVVTNDTYKSMGYSRGASALGVAAALGELPAGGIGDDAVCRRLDLWSGRASTSAGIELMHNEVVVLGNSAAWASEAVIAHRVMRDAIDLPAAIGALSDAGLPPDGQLTPQQRDDLLAVLAKADPASTGHIRGARHIMLDDSDINATRHARALVGGVLAGVAGRTDLFVSGGAEHQGPDGGGVVAVIARQCRP
ncbi:MAG TPA: ring-opening amidohydrolase [Rhodopila sp.]|uniref:cyanuric acid amidohydrolase n=1 Tax=Rhodopila sp. TaxID=2480087 RepID=UPI002CB12970|nr:ring-opening amidohydrolase [Rhodopila sp.]HVY17813.1 ring-opening amidohydrolase [Rhodopila sp.]